MRQRDAIWVAVLALLAGGVAGCNDTKLAPSPIETAPPSPTPTGDDPIAVINGGSPTYAPLATATFDGSASYDPAGEAITAYAWSVLSAPAGSVSQLQSTTSNGDHVDFFVDLAGDYTIQLVVTNQSGHNGTAVYAFSAVPTGDLHVELTWPNQYTEADMDLHLINRTQPSSPAHMWDTTYDCHWENCKPSEGENLGWWAAGNGDNPRLDIDNISESVPENINIDVPHAGTYRVEVHYWANNSAQINLSVDINVNIYIGGALAYTKSVTMTDPDQIYEVGDIVWGSGTGTVTPIDQMSTCTFLQSGCP